LFNRISFISLKVSTDSHAHSQFQKTIGLNKNAVPAQHRKLEDFKNPLQEIIYIIKK